MAFSLWKTIWNQIIHTIVIQITARVVLDDDDGWTSIQEVNVTYRLINGPIRAQESIKVRAVVTAKINNQ